ncbi:hypothetical protein PGTUg99_050075 [Puccinia graminis f. sp. tritici]|uniref:Uncharacterized protein n=1 Tax=Puccinia graminis f. sp. tritici TaxID=56615 RepID=A0A5B0PC58_PUCGR|nr:hypothetical protein PGTUg99_050075 [Puccinia graminis f. sp. tritici]
MNEGRLRTSWWHEERQHLHHTLNKSYNQGSRGKKRVKFPVEGITLGIRSSGTLRLIHSRERRTMDQKTCILFCGLVDLPPPPQVKKIFERISCL